MNARTTQWQEWASFALGLWLAMSPWLLGHDQEEAATANAALVGLVLALGSHFEVSFDGLPAEWFNASAGAWLIAAPFVLGFSTRVDAAANSIAAGILVAALGFSAFWAKRAANPPRPSSLAPPRRAA